MSYFLNDNLAPLWVVCHNDSLHRGDAAPNTSGITCDALNNAGSYQRLTILGDPSLTDPYPSTDPVLARDPRDNTVWLVSIINYRNLSLPANQQARMAVGLAHLRRSMDGASVEMAGTDVSGTSGVAFMRAITETEGPMNSTLGPNADRPFIAIDPGLDGQYAGQQYIAYFNNSNQGDPKGRIAFIRRKMNVPWAWNAPVPLPTPAGLPTDASGFVKDSMNCSDDQYDVAHWPDTRCHYQVQAPQLAVDTLHHTVVAAFVRLQLESGTGGLIGNTSYIGHRIYYYFSFSNAGAANWFSTIEVDPSLRPRAGGVIRGDGLRPFTAVPSPSLVIDDWSYHCHVAYPISTITTPGMGTSGSWKIMYSSTSDGSSWTTAQVDTAFPQGVSVKDSLFPSLAWEPSSGSLVVGYISSDLVDKNWRAWASCRYAWSGPDWGTANQVSTDTTSGPVPWLATPAIQSEYSWTTGPWPGSTRAGFLGDYAGIAIAPGGLYSQSRAFFAWTDCRGSSTSNSVIDVWGASLDNF